MSDKSDKKTEIKKKWIDTVKFSKAQLPSYYIEEEPEVDNSEN